MKLTKEQLLWDRQWKQAYRALAYLMGHYGESEMPAIQLLGDVVRECRSRLASCAP
jgi:hypothetical protein